MTQARLNAARSAYADRPPTHAPEWHGLVVCDVLLNNLSTGLFLAAAVTELLLAEPFRSPIAWAYPLALLLLLADLACLVLDLGDPLRFHHMLRVFKPSSPMSLGTWSLTAYAMSLGAIVVLEFLATVGLLPSNAGWVSWVHRLTVLAGMVPAFASAAYKGVLFSTTAQPGWRDARWLGAYLVNSAVMLGCAQLLALATLTGDGRITEALRIALAVLIGLNMIPLGLLFAELRPTLVRAYSAVGAHGGAVVLFIGGALGPLAVLLTGRGGIATATALFLLILAALGLRSMLIRLPHRVIRE